MYSLFLALFSPFQLQDNVGWVMSMFSYVFLFFIVMPTVLYINGGKSDFINLISSRIIKLFFFLVWFGTWHK